MHFFRKTFSKDLESQRLSFQSFWFTLQWSWSRNDSLILLFSRTFAVYTVYSGQKNNNRFALWDAAPGLRMHPTACSSFLSCIIHHLAPPHVSPFCSFEGIFVVRDVVFLFVFQSCMLIWWLSFHFSVDVWSVGCIMAEMVRGSVLFPGTDRILKLKLHPDPPKMPSRLILCLASCSYLCTRWENLPSYQARLMSDVSVGIGFFRWLSWRGVNLFHGRWFHR